MSECGPLQACKVLYKRVDPPVSRNVPSVPHGPTTPWLRLPSGRPLAGCGWAGALLIIIPKMMDMITCWRLLIPKLLSYGLAIHVLTAWTPWTIRVPGLNCQVDAMETHGLESFRQGMRRPPAKQMG
jgi:hypothetical protein